jgi:hypothetical protein
MSKFRDEYMQGLTDRVKAILNKDELSNNDIDLLYLYQFELSKYEYVSPQDKLLEYVKNILRREREKNDGIQ